MINYNKLFFLILIKFSDFLPYNNEKISLQKQKRIQITGQSYFSVCSEYRSGQFYHFS